MLSRRQFMIATTALSGILFLPGQALFCRQENAAQTDLKFHIFSKHLQFLDYKEMAEAAANLGFDGIDLTVRKGGHVLPERVQDDLPRAVEAIENTGLRHEMMATDVNNAAESVHVQVLQTAASLGVKYYRLGYVRFVEEVPIPQRLAELNRQMKELAVLNRDLKITGAYQNHSGTGVGSEIWDIYHLLEDIDPREIGCQYDIRHAVVEGGQSWENGLRLIAPQINCMVLKDFVWARGKYGRWEVKNVPLGEGMVDFLSYFKLLKAWKIDVPVCIHYEYDLGGVEHGADKLSGMTAAEVFKVMKKDLQFAKKIWQQA